MRRTRIRRISKRQEEIRALDALLREIVLRRDGNRCQRCGKRPTSGRGGGLEVAHLLPKGTYPALRHELRNVLLMCYRCHHILWHRDPIGSWLWLQEKCGVAFVNELRLAGQTRSKVDLAAVRIHLNVLARQSGSPPRLGH